MKASVIIPTYNRANILAHTLHSLTQQQLATGQSMEVLVVDDGSADHTEAVVDLFSQQLPLTYLWQDDRGNRTGEARNKAIDRATGDIAVFVDSGMLLASDCVTAHLATYLRHPEPLAVVGYAYGFEQFNELDAALWQHVDVDNPDQTIRRFRNMPAFGDMRDTCYTRCNDQIDQLPAPWVFYWTCNVSARLTDLREVGCFDLDYDQSWGFEDIDLAYRLQLAGVRIVLNRNAMAVHLPHAKEDDAFKLQSQTRNARQFHQKYNSLQSRLYLETNLMDFNDYLIGKGVGKNQPALLSL
ncbi:glycosyltransferase family 2 protein [Fibrella sp. WM1]|uniref:glycosyltransferase family 2 protein n=1 Tax=Fibrella musci TaxID=3242485 RepID=UPI003521618B